MIYPTLEEVNNADRLEICRWWRKLQAPNNRLQANVMTRIAQRFKEVGGFTPEISKAVGWDD